MGKDVVFLIDSSEDATINIYMKEKRFVNTLVKELGASSPLTQTAVAKYAQESSTIAQFTDKDFSTLLMASELDNTKKNIPKALRHAYDIFTKSSAWLKSEKLLTVLIVGSPPLDKISRAAVKEAAKPLKNAMVKIKIVKHKYEWKIICTKIVSVP